MKDMLVAGVINQKSNVNLQNELITKIYEDHNRRSELAFRLSLVLLNKLTLH
jgi:hypothetical protein